MPAGGIAIQTLTRRDNVTDIIPEQRIFVPGRSDVVGDDAVVLEMYCHTGRGSSGVHYDPVFTSQASSSSSSGGAVGVGSFSQASSSQADLAQSAKRKRSQDSHESS